MDTKTGAVFILDVFRIPAFAAEDLKYVIKWQRKKQENSNNVKTGVSVYFHKLRIKFEIIQTNAN